jgi:SAM-dependent methyltransferase
MDYSKRRKGKAKEKGSPKDMGEELPFEASCFHCVISEFTLSMVSSLNTRLEEIKRVLKKNGCFAIADIFSKSSTVLPDTEGEEDFITGILSLEEVQKSLAYAGFKNVYMGEYSDLLNNSLANIENKNSLTDKAGLFVLIAFKEE